MKSTIPVLSNSALAAATLLICFNSITGAATLNYTTAGDFAAAATLVPGQFGAESGTNTFATLTMSGTSSVQTANIALGGANAGSAVYGVIEGRHQESRFLKRRRTIPVKSPASSTFSSLARAK